MTAIGAYYFPGFHADERTARWHGSGWTEWDVLKHARPRFPGHQQPKVPAWGSFDEADPVWAARQASVAAAAGIDFFIFDWYWYENGPFLHRALDQGYLRAGQTDTLFALMWANHDWLDIHPASASQIPTVLLRGAVDDYTFDCLADELISKYFHHENYFRVDGGPYFSLYEPQTLVDGFGSADAAARALDRLRKRVSESGLGDLHLNLILSDRSVLPGERITRERDALLQTLGAASVTSYVWIHHSDPSQHGFPIGSYDAAGAENATMWQRLRDSLAVSYFPNVTVGWDSSPRTVQSDTYDDRGYPWTAVLESSPHQFGTWMESALTFAGMSDGPQIVTVNAWNEWTEGSYLLPDDRHGSAYLEACRRARQAVDSRARGA